MDKQHLREQLQNLHAELGRADSMDEESRRLLRDVAEDIRRIIEGADAEGSREMDAKTRGERASGGGAEHPEALDDFRGTLENSAREFEVEHPALTEAINRILDALPK